MEKLIFYAPDILENSILPEDESNHCIRVLRKKAGDAILITDGKGRFFNSVISDAHPKHCTVDILEIITETKHRAGFVHIAFAPTKNLDRIEWFAEKATEIGIDRITPLLCNHSERKEMKLVRIEKILVSAMKQSQKAYLPRLDDMTAFSSFIQQQFNGQKFIAHCLPEEKALLKNLYKIGENVLILIGPEGDFSEKEVNDAINNGFKPISLGSSRLRTETAALVACNTIQILND